MSESTESERERIREQKRKELLEKHGVDTTGDDEGADAQTVAPSEPVEIRGGDHLQSVLDDYEVVLVDCYAEWCGPCQMMEPAIEAVAAETDAAVAKVDIDANRQLAMQLGAQSVPTIVLFADGEPVDRRVGAQSQPALEQLIEQAA